MNLIVPYIPGFAFLYKNYRKKSRVEHQLSLNNSMYEGAARSDFRTPKLDEYEYDSVEIVREN